VTRVLPSWPATLQALALVAGPSLGLRQWLVRELKPNKKLFLDHLSFILHGALMGVGTLWPRRQGTTKHEQP